MIDEKQSDRMSGTIVGVAEFTLNEKHSCANIRLLRLRPLLMTLLHVTDVISAFMTFSSGSVGSTLDIMATLMHLFASCCYGL